MKIIFYLVLAILFYLIASFINIELNPLYWGTFTKAVYITGAIFSAIIIVEVE